MAGITYLYGLWNMNMLGDSPVTMMDAHLDVQACLGTLEALSGGYLCLNRLRAEKSDLSCT
jgi:hypothetical protein